MKTYNIHDILEAGCNLEPVRCVHCLRVGEVTFLQVVGDGRCGYCGKWQLED